MSEDVLVVGGGIEGYAAALSALDADPGAAVRLLRVGDRFAAETGLLDLFGFAPDESGPVAEPLSAIDRLPDSHPYSRLGLGTVREGLTLFDDVTGDRYAGEATETNALLPTAVGELAPAIRYPRSMANGVVSGPPSMRLVGFEELPDFDAELAADRLGDRTPLAVMGDTVQLPVSADSPVEMAGQFEENTTVDERPMWDALVETLEPTLDIEPRIGLPAVLGESETAAIMRTVSERLRVSVFEVPLGPPSVPGRRLESLLAEAVESRGGELDRTSELSGVETSDGRISRVLTGEEEFEADSYVLATGGVESGGLVGGPHDLREPVFDCPVALPGDSLVDEQFLGDHPAVRAGVQTDESRRPVESDGSTVAENLYAAGRVLESPNVVADHAAGGFALVTGYEAGRRASD